MVNGVDLMDQARGFVRYKQAEAAGLLAPRWDEQNVLAQALRVAEQFERGAYLDDGLLRVGNFRYDPLVERERWRRTREVIERCAPGPHENGTMLALLAREAATLEMWASGQVRGPDFSPVMRKIVFGTAARPGSHASSYCIGGATAVLMSTGMMTFLYQAAKTVLFAWRQVSSGKRLTAFSSHVEDVRDVLNQDSTATEGLTRLLSSWLFKGVPKSPNSSLSPLNHMPTLSRLVSASERFILAHECVHVAMDLLRPPGFTATPVLSGWDKEFRADVWAMAMVVQSSSRYERIAPNMALQGPVFVMKAHELVDRSLAFVQGSTPAITHPPFEHRLKKVVDAYMTIPGDVTADTAFMPDPAQFAAVTLEMVWDRIVKDLRKRLESGESLHSIWTDGK